MRDASVTLLSRLKACVPDERDIPLLLTTLAGGGERTTKAGVAEYLTAGPKQCLFATVRYRDGLIASLKPGPALATGRAQDDFIARARIDAAQTHGTVVSSRVLFSGLPLKGAFKWRDQFRISPCPRRARIGRGLDWFESHRFPDPALSHLGPPFPLVLEVRTFRSPNPVLEANRIVRDLDTYQYLLTVLLHGRVRYVHHIAERQWISVMRRNRIEYHLLHAGFDPGLDGRAEGFVRRRMNLAPTYDGPDYYNHSWGRDEQLQLPDTIDKDLIAFHGLRGDLLWRFNRACYWYSLAVQFNREPSLSTLGFAAAVECLLPRPSKSRCPSCGKSTGPGPTKCFTDHLKKYGVVPPSLNARRDAIYNVRSALVHGSHTKRTDDGFFRQVDSFVDPLLLEIVTQRSLLGWLRDPRRTI